MIDLTPPMPYQESYPGELDIYMQFVSWMGWDVMFSGIAADYPFGI